MRCTEQVKGRNANCVQKHEEPACNRAQTTIQLRWTIGEPGTQLIERINGGVLGERRDRKAPGEGVPHEAVQQDEGGTGAGLQIAHATTVDGDEALFSSDRRRRGKILLAVRFHAGFFGPPDNSFLGPGVYVSDIASVASE